MMETLKKCENGSKNNFSQKRCRSLAEEASCILLDLAELRLKNPKKRVFLTKILNKKNNDGNP